MALSYYLKAMLNPKQAFRRLHFTELKAASYINNIVNPEYIWLDDHITRNTTLLDIGAFIGDTALYFARNKNIKQILSYEPLPSFYQEAKREISISPYKEKIKLYNNAVSNTPRSQIINKSRVGMFSYNDMNGKEGEVIRAIPLWNVLKNLKNVAIKMDIEGEEHEIFANKDLSLKNVYIMEIEYHNNLQEIIQNIKNHGFKVKYDVVPDDKTRGMVYAIK